MLVVGLISFSICSHFDGLRGVSRCWTCVSQPRSLHLVIHYVMGRISSALLTLWFHSTMTSSQNISTLPPPTANQSYCHVSVLEAEQCIFLVPALFPRLIRRSEVGALTGVPHHARSNKRALTLRRWASEGTLTPFRQPLHWMQQHSSGNGRLRTPSSTYRARSRRAV